MATQAPAAKRSKVKRDVSSTSLSLWNGPTRSVGRGLRSAPKESQWQWLRVDEGGDVQLGRQRSPKSRSADYPTKYLRAANITERGLDLSDVLEMDFNPDERERYRLHAGDIILSDASASASQVGKPAIWRDELPLCCFQNTVIRLRPKRARPEYLLWLFTHFYRNGVFAQVAGGVGINHLSAAKSKQLVTSVPSDAEQRRIVAEIEKQFTRLDAGVAALERVQANLKRYRAAVATVPRPSRPATIRRRRTRSVGVVDTPFPGRTLVPKTLIRRTRTISRSAQPRSWRGRLRSSWSAPAKDDSHAEDIVHLCREVFGRGNDFCKKIPYQAKHPITGRPAKSKELIKVSRPQTRPTAIRRRRTRRGGAADTFCLSPTLRIVVTVDT